MGNSRHERVRDLRAVGDRRRRRDARSSDDVSPGSGSRGVALTTALLTISAIVAVAPTVASAGPPPNRAYERVSPADKPSGATGLSTRTGGLAMPARSADTGERVVYGLSASVFDSLSGAANPLIFGERTATGWRGRTAIRSMDDGETPVEVSTHEPRSAWMTADGSELVFGTSRPLSGGPVSGVFGQIYRAVDSDAAPAWLSEPTGGLPMERGIQQLTISTGDDTQTQAFASQAPLVPGAPPIGNSAVYARNADGELQIAGRLPDGSVPDNAYLANSGPSMNGTTAPARTKRNEVAGGGRFVLFSEISAQPSPLYVRDLEQNVTRQLAGGGGQQPDVAANLYDAAADEDGNSPGPATVPFGLAFGARDGNRAYFVGQTDNGGTPTTGVFEANLATGTVTSRPAITGAPLEVTPDGQRLLFLTPPTAGVHQLRYWDAADPNVSVLIGEIDAPNVMGWGLARVFEPSADARTWTFLAAGSLDPDRPNATPDARQLYRWTVGPNDPTCLTCESVDGVARYAGVNLSVQDGGRSESMLKPSTVAAPGDDVTLLAQPGHGPSDDGRWLLFDSPDRLVAEDTNNVRDVYLWDRDAAPGHQLQLVTSGQGNVPSWALDLSPDGVNAFFLTREGLVPGDDDKAYDVYTARIGGGFPDSPEACVGEECRPPVIPDPPRGPVGSDRLTPPSSGKGQEAQQGTPKLRVRSVRTSAQRLTVRVDTPKAGKIRISGKQVRTTSRTAKRATTYTLQVPLSTSARSQVARGKTVKVQLRVQFTPQGSKKSTRVSSSVSVRKGR